jgi:hypothetical protein
VIVPVWRWCNLKSQNTIDKCANAEHLREAQVLDVGALAIEGFVRRRLLKLAGAVGAPKARARALFPAGVLADEQVDQAAADTVINESQDIALQSGDKTGVAAFLNALAVFARDRGDVARHPLPPESVRQLSVCGAVSWQAENPDARLVRRPGAESLDWFDELAY